jgi:hypothetical protein
MSLSISRISSAFNSFISVVLIMLVSFQTFERHQIFKGFSNCLYTAKFSCILVIRQECT